MIAQLRPRHLRLQAVVDDGALPRGAGGAGARAGGRPVGVPARLGRRGLDGGRQAVRPGDRARSPAPAARGQRPDAQGREPQGARDAAQRSAWANTSTSWTRATTSWTRSRARSSPKQKRQIIGDTFVEVFEREARRLGIEGHLLGQGTIYPDTIETGGTKRADTIKTHHNRVPVVEQMIDAGRVVEPLAELYKVEVRELGERLGIPREMIWRHPFPGPGLGVRLLCSRGVEDREGFAEIEPKVAEVAGRYGLSTPRAADPVGRREGRPAVVRAPGDAGRRRRLGAAARGVGHDLEAGARAEPLHLEHGPDDADARRGRWPPA